MLKVFAPLLLLVACVAAFMLNDPLRPRADVTIINRSEISTLDPATMSWAQDFRMARLIGEGLVRQDVFTREMRPLPGVAESWTIEDSGRVLRFQLRKDARWSDGSPLTAQEFIATWRRNLLPETGADYLTLFRLIQGGAEFFTFRKEQLKEYRKSPGTPERAAAAWAQALEFFDANVGLRAPSDHELVVTLARPVPYMLDVLAFPAFFPVHQESILRSTTLDPVTGEVRVDPRWTRPPALVCNGPFVISDWQFKRGMRFQRNPNYWNARAINVESIDCPSIEDPAAQVLAYKTGAADWVFDVSAPFRDEMLARRAAFLSSHGARVQELRAQGRDDVAIVRELPADPASEVHVFNSFGTYFYNINCAAKLPDGRENPLADARVRRALALSIDKQSIVANIRRAGETAAEALIPPNSIAGYTSPRGLGYDPALARELLAQAGYPEGLGFINLEILFNKDGGHDLIAQAVAKDWERQLGISVRLVMKETKVFREDLKNGRFMISRASWFGDYGDPTTFLDVNRSDDNNNDRKYANEQFDSLLAQAADLYADPSARMSLLAQAEGMLIARDLPLIPLFHYVEINLFDAHRISGATTHPRQVQDLTRIDILGDGKGADTPLELERAK